MFDEEEPIYDIERMFGFNEWHHKLNKKGLIELRQALLDKSFDKTYNVENVKVYIKDYFSEYSGVSSFQRFVS